jgi:arginine decarboxylase
MPIHKLNIKPTRAATIWDITCDSDGEISFDGKKPIFLHDIDLENEEYFIGIFLLGAYQEVLGMDHNLFTHPTEVSVEISDDGYELKDYIISQSLLDILEDIDYDTKEIQAILSQNIINSSLNKNEKEQVLKELFDILNENGYLKTTR